MYSKILNYTKTSVDLLMGYNSYLTEDVANYSIPKKICTYVAFTPLFLFYELNYVFATCVCNVFFNRFNPLNSKEKKVICVKYITDTFAKIIKEEYNIELNIVVVFEELLTEEYKDTALEKCLNRELPFMHIKIEDEHYNVVNVDKLPDKLTLGSMFNILLLNMCEGANLMDERLNPIEFEKFAYKHHNRLFKMLDECSKVIKVLK